MSFYSLSTFTLSTIATGMVFRELIRVSYVVYGRKPGNTEETV